MTILQNKRIVVLGEDSELLSAVVEELKAEGAVIDYITMGQTADVAVYVAAPPNPDESLGQYIGTVVSYAAKAVGALTPDNRQERAIVLVCPRLSGATLENVAALSAAVGALKGLSRGWVVQLGELGVRSNVVVPGLLSDIGDRPHPTIPLARRDGNLGVPSDIAKTVAYLSSNDASYISGAEIDVDGGLSEDRHSLLSVLWAEGVTTPDRNPLREWF